MDACSLLALPEAALREVLSWSPSYADADAFMKTCRALNQQRTDPSSAALVLLRRPAQQQASSMRALAASSRCRGGTAAVVEQALQLLKAGPDSGGPYAAPEPVLQAMLNTSCEAGAVASMLGLLRLLPPTEADTCTEQPRAQTLLFRACSAGATPSIRALLALLVPPDVDAQGGRALRLALNGGPHVAALQVLLEHGANPCVPTATRFCTMQMQNRPTCYTLFSRAAVAPGCLSALQLLLLHCPDAQKSAAVGDALHSAVLHRNCATVAHLLPLPRDGNDDEFAGHVNRAASSGDCELLRLLLAHITVPVTHLNRSLHAAVWAGHTECVEMLLDHGAEMDGTVYGSSALGLAIQGCLSALHDGERALGLRQSVLTLLLRRGATVTPLVRAQVWAAGRSAETGAALRDVTQQLNEAFQWQADRVHESL